MKSVIKSLLCLALASLIGCSRDNASESASDALEPSAPSGISADWEKTRQQVVDSLKQQKASLDQQISAMKVQAGMLRGDARQSFETAINAVEEHSKGVEQAMADAQKASADQWEQAKTRLNASWGELQSAFEKASAAVR